MNLTNYEVPHYAVFSILPPLPPSQVHVFSSSCSQTPSIYIIPLMWETKFRTHTKQQVELRFFIF